jgi:hypothetical protein
VGNFDEQPWGISASGVIRDGDDDQVVHLYYGNEHLREVTIDPTRRYQGQQPLASTGAAVT